MPGFNRRHNPESCISTQTCFKIYQESLLLKGTHTNITWNINTTDLKKKKKKANLHFQVFQKPEKISRVYYQVSCQGRCHVLFRLRDRSGGTTVDSRQVWREWLKQQLRPRVRGWIRWLLRLWTNCDCILRYTEQW